MSSEAREEARANEKCGYLDGVHQNCSKGFVCTNHVCLCPPPYSVIDDVCTNSSTPQSMSSPCDPACQPPQLCVNNRCECADGVSCVIADVSRRRRKRNVEQSMVCWPGAAQCSAGNGVCIDNVCHCINGYVEADGVCAPEFVRINEKCDPNNVSPRCMENAICTNGVCVCAVPGGCDRENLHTGPRYSDGRCTTDRQCQNGRCVAGRCHCNEGFILQSGICVSVIGAFKNINGQCTVGDRCSGGSTCRANVCQCVDGSSEHHGRCRQSPGGRCTYGETCDGGSSCEFGLCRCPDGHIINTGRCVMGSAEPGKSCQNGQKCVHGSVCRFGMCMCVAKYVTSKGRCVGSLKGPGFECHEKDICNGGSTCREGFCVCNDLEVIINGQCVGSHEKANEVVDNLLVAAPGQPCDARTNCTGGSTCINRVCTCEHGAIDESGRCSEVRKEYGANAAPAKKSPDHFQPGSACALTIECPYRTQCVRGVCRCKKGETIVDNTCRKAIHQVLPGGKCDPRKGYDCIGEAHCFYGVCTCTRHLINNGKECVTVTEMEMVTPGKRCGPGQSCNGGSRCIDGICRCPEDEVPDVNKKCVKKSQVYPVFDKLSGISTTPVYQPEPVLPTSTSVPNITPALDMMGELEAFEAMLKANPSFSQTETVPQTIFGHTCQTKDECPANAFCFQQLCRCMIGFRASAGYCQPISANCVTPPMDQGKPCAQLAHPGEDCTHGQVCSFNSYCGLFSGVCECPSGMATTNERCERTLAAPGLGCVTSRNCYGSSYCDNGLCLCKTGYELVNDFCVPVGQTPTGSMKDLSFKPVEPYFTSTVSSSVPAVYSSATIPLDFSKPPFNFPAKPQIKAYYPNFNQQQMPAPSQAPVLPEAQRFSGFSMPFAKGANTRSGDVLPETAAKAFLKLKATPFVRSSFVVVLRILSLRNGICSIRKRMSPNPRHNNDEGISSQEEDDFAEERQFAAPLENCQNFEFCTGGSECSNIQGMGLVCQCPTNRIFLEDECVDVPRNANLAGIGESCRNGEICLGGSRCLQNICMCDENRHDILGICVTTARPGDDCSNGQICVDGAVCAASVKACVCPPGRISKLGRCVEKEHALGVPKTVGPGSECGSQAICEDNSFCSGEGVCVCLPRFELYGEKCVPNVMVKHPGDGCNSGNMCSAGSECRDNVCTCPSGQLIIEGKCVRVTNDIRKRPVRPDCTLDTDCSDHYRCVDQKCVCHGNFSYCLRLVLKRAEASCREDAHCPEHAVCTDNICTCKDEYKMISNFCVPSDMNKWRIVKGTKTVKDIALNRGSEPGASCSDANSCTVGSVCVNGQCVCDFGSVPEDGSCVSKSGNLGVGEHCSDAYKCRDGLVCVLERCMCPDDDLTCDGPLDTCVGGAMCVDGLCVCPSGMHPSPQGRCEPSTATSAPSASSAHILSPGSVHAAEFTHHHTHQPFQPRSSSQPVPTHATTPLLTFANTASETDECAAIGLYCRSNTVCRDLNCQCPDDYVLHHDGCVPPHEAGRKKARGKARHQGGLFGFQ
ncbi:EGF-like domain protein [Ostertagia ostertagi]